MRLSSVKLAFLPHNLLAFKEPAEKNATAKKRQATATTTINHLPLLPFCQTPGSESQSFASAKGPKSKYTSSDMFCRTPDALTTGGTLLGRGRGSIRGMALRQKMST
jgi:hypothetical protein